MVSLRERFEDVNKKLESDLSKLRKLLPLTRGGNPRPLKKIASRKPKPIPTSPAPAGDEVRFRPTEPFKTSQITPVLPTFIPQVTESSMITKEVPQMDIIEEIVNNPAIQITEEMLPIINDPGMLMKNGTLFASLAGANLPMITPEKRKRKVSEYQKLFGKILKQLKKKHPRTRIQDLMKRAHRMTRKQLKK